MRLTLFLLALSPIALTAAPAYNIVHDSVAHFESGVVCDPPSTDSRSAPGMVAGETYVFEGDAAFISRDHIVPAAQGISFGVKVQMHAPDGLDDVTLIVTHPPMGPDKVTRQTSRGTISGASVSQRYYAFDFEYEMIHGVWQLMAEQDGTLIYSTTFDVVPPDRAPELTRLCGLGNLLS